ncbi:hypothetical protein EXIGLDRAFT_447792 [Exidia glandulosa HHB12029]|uniref:Uncharacterized protein n=1 Tax=Exidia glandulosa HHB12029 TaxID=1314781 RepID=A0A165B581_EXIGL|nr:hypothetical protein EXIGLDRAFT_447792 [Exidia glandulosa HHB12029]
MMFRTDAPDGTKTSDWADGAPHPELYHWIDNGKCVTSPNMHSTSEADASGTVLAIAYKSEVHDVQYEDLVVVSVAPNTPWKRIAKYEIPNLPACPEDGCVCAWGWSPNWCAQDNLYMNGFKCKVIGAKNDALPLGKAQKAVWCEDDSSKCVSGPKGLIIHSQNDDFNTVPEADLHDLSKLQKDGHLRSPGYNMKMGFVPGAQHDIFVRGAAQSPAPRANRIHGHRKHKSAMTTI